MESQHGQRLGVEADRYAALQRDMAQALDAAAAEKQATADSHSRSTTDLTKRYDAQLQVSNHPSMVGSWALEQHACASSAC